MKRKLRGMKRRAIQLDFDLYRVTVPIPDIPGENLSVIDIAPARAKNAIMFVHGYAGCAETWEFQINHFAREYRVVAPDLRGHGQSDAPLSSYTMPEMVADLHAVANTLHLPEKFILIGHSFGGSICVEYAVAHPERLEKLVLLATAGEYPLPKITALAYRIPTWFFRPWWKYRPRWNAEIHVMKRMALNNLRRWKGWEKLHAISTPTLVVTGERDKYFPRYVFDEVMESIPNAEVYDVGSAKHKVQLERHTAVNRAITRFIEDKQRSTWRDLTNTTNRLEYRPWLKSYSPTTPATVPIPHQPLHKFLESAAYWVPKQTATIFYGKTLTYFQLERLANQFAHALHGMGVSPGDRVMIVLPNTPQMVVAYYAALKIGAAVVLPNPDASAAQIIAQIADTAPKVFVTLREFSGLVQIVTSQPDTPKLILTDIRHAVSGGVYKKMLVRWQAAGATPVDLEAHPSVGQLMTEVMMDSPVEPPEISVSPNDLAVVIFTGGTTSDPKGVRLTHSNLVANALQTRHWVPNLTHGKERFLSVVPLLHSYGMTAAMNVPILLGSAMILLPVFEVEQVLEHIQTYKPTIFPGVPSMYTALNMAPNVRQYGLSSIKACISGGAPLPIEVQEAFEKLTHAHLVEGYGLTEASPITHANPIEGENKVGFIGVPLPDTDARIVDLVTGETLPPGNIGELAVRGPQVMQGYWGDAPNGGADTESALRDGWLFTGDVAVMDADGYFQIVSRKRDAITAGDFSVYPRDVEEVLYENNKVMEVAVVGVPTDQDDAERIKAYVVPRPGTTLSKEELLVLCRRRLEPYAVPWDIEFREELPKSFVGKVLRRMLVTDGK